MPNISFAREEVAVCLDVVNRLNATAALGDDLGEKVNMLRQAEFGEQYRSSDLESSVEYAKSVKQQDIEYFCETLNIAHSRLEKLVKAEHSFYENEAMELRKKNWFLQEKLQGPYRGELFINYGYKHGLIDIIRWISV